MFKRKKWSFEFTDEFNENITSEYDTTIDFMSKYNNFKSERESILPYLKLNNNIIVFLYDINFNSKEIIFYTKYLYEEKYIDCLIFLENRTKSIYFIKKPKSTYNELIMEISGYVKKFTYKIIKKKYIPNFKDDYESIEEFLEIKIFYNEFYTFNNYGKHYIKVINEFKRYNLFLSIIKDNLTRGYGWFKINIFNKINNNNNNNNKIIIKNIDQIIPIKSNKFPNFNILGIQIAKNILSQEISYISLIFYKDTDILNFSKEKAKMNYVNFINSDENLNNTNKKYYFKNEKEIIKKLEKFMVIINPDFIVVNEINTIKFLAKKILQYKLFESNEFGKYKHGISNLNESDYEYIFNGRIIINSFEWFKLYLKEDIYFNKYRFDVNNINQNNNLNIMLNCNYLFLNLIFNMPIFKILIELSDLTLLLFRYISLLSIPNISVFLLKKEFHINDYIINYKKISINKGKSEGIKLNYTFIDYYKKLIFEIDINSFYPSIIINKNLCRTKENLNNNLKLIPNLLKNLLKIKINFENEKLNTPLIKLIKQLSNTLIGIFNSSKNIFYNKKLWNLIIKYSREEIDEIINFIQNKYKTKIIHNKVDSFFINTNIKDNLILATILVNEIKISLNKRFKLTFKTKKIFSKICIIDKNSYYGFILNNNNRFKLNQNLTRYNTPNICKIIINEIAMMILKESKDLKSNFIKLIKSLKSRINEHQILSNFEYYTKLNKPILNYINEKKFINIFEFYINLDIPEEFIYYNYFKYVKVINKNINSKNGNIIELHLKELNENLIINKTIYFSEITLNLIKKIIKPINELYDIDLKNIGGIKKEINIIKTNNWLIRYYYKIPGEYPSFKIYCSFYHHIIINYNFNNNIIFCNTCFEYFYYSEIVVKIYDYLKNLKSSFHSNRLYCNICFKLYDEKYTLDNKTLCKLCFNILKTQYNLYDYEYVIFHLKNYLKNIMFIPEIKEVFDKFDSFINLDNLFISINNN